MLRGEMKRLLVAPLILGLASPVQASVDPEVHKLCLKATNYRRCVSAQSGETPELRLVEGAKELTGNKCPSGFAYTGAGICREILSADPFFKPFDLDHIGLLAAGWTPRLYALGAIGSLYFGEIIKAVEDPKCPLKEPYLYRNSACEPALKAPSLKEIRRVLKSIPKRNRDIDKWNNSLFKLFKEEGLATKAMNYSSAIKSNITSPIDME